MREARHSVRLAAVRGNISDRRDRNGALFVPAQSVPCFYSSQTLNTPAAGIDTDRAARVQIHKYNGLVMKPGEVAELMRKIERSHADAEDTARDTLASGRSRSR